MERMPLEVGVLLKREKIVILIFYFFVTRRLLGGIMGDRDRFKAPIKKEHL